MNQHRPSRPRPNIGPTNDIGPTWPDTIRSFRRGFQALKERAMLGQAQAQHGPNIAPKPLCIFGFYFIFLLCSVCHWPCRQNDCLLSTLQCYPRVCREIHPEGLLSPCDRWRPWCAQSSPLVVSLSSRADRQEEATSILSTLQDALHFCAWFVMKGNANKCDFSLSLKTCFCVSQ